MTGYILFKYLHFISIFGMVSMLIVELILVQKTMTRSEISRLSKLDALYGLFAILVVAAGMTLWFGVGKPSVFYANPILYIKVGIVIVVGLISSVPTVFFIRNRKGEATEAVNVPSRIKQLIILQLVLLATVPPLATMMASGMKW